MKQRLSLTLTGFCLLHLSCFSLVYTYMTDNTYDQAETVGIQSVREVFLDSLGRLQIVFRLVNGRQLDLCVSGRVFIRGELNRSLYEFPCAPAESSEEKAKGVGPSGQKGPVSQAIRSRGVLYLPEQGIGLRLGEKYFNKTLVLCRSYSPPEYRPLQNTPLISHMSPARRVRFAHGSRICPDHFGNEIETSSRLTLLPSVKKAALGPGGKIYLFNSKNRVLILQPMRYQDHIRDLIRFEVAPGIQAGGKVLPVSLPPEALKKLSIIKPSRGLVLVYLKVPPEPEADEEAKKTARYKLSVFEYPAVKAQGRRDSREVSRRFVMMEGSELILNMKAVSSRSRYPVIYAGYPLTIALDVVTLPVQLATVVIGGVVALIIDIVD